MKISKGNLIAFIVSIATGFLLLVVAAFFDLTLSLEMYNPSSFFGKCFDVLGQAPCYLMLPLSVSFIFAYVFNKKGKLALLFKIGCVFASVAVWAVIMHIYFGEEVSLFIQLLISLPFNALLFAFIKCSEQTKIKLLKFAVFTLIVISLSILVNQALKFLWGRYRFRDLVKADNLEAFTPWWHIRGINGNKSFPSGHVTAATTMFVIMYACELFNFKKGVKITLASLISVYVVCVALSRIVLGAHYLSDVTAGFMITLTIYIILYTIMKNKEDKIFKGCYAKEE